MADRPPAPHGAAQADTLATDAAPLRAAPLSSAQLAVHGRQLAARHRLAGRAPAADLLSLLDANAAAIAAACDVLDRAARAGFALPPCAAHLLEHYHLVDAQVRLARGELLHAVRALPRLAPGGEARAWSLVLEAVAHGDGRVEPDQLARFLAAYQEGLPLALAELDALPALLRVALIDNLRRLAARAARACQEREAAAGWAVRMVDTAEQRPGDLVLLVADMARSRQPLGSSFVAELARRLHGQGTALARSLDWIGARLADAGSSIAQQMQLERSEEADDAVSAANSLASLRLACGIDWRAFGEGIGAVEQVLRTDPDGSYGRMDGPTRDLYRQAVERLALATGQGEAEVAEAALALAGVHRDTGEGGLDRRLRHVGYYLAGPGRAQLEERLRGATGGPGWLRRLRHLRRQALTTRIGASAALGLLFALALALHARQDGAGPLLPLLVALLALPGASQLARALVRMMSGWLAPPAPTPRMDFGAGLPREAQTVVAVSCQLGGGASLAALCRELEMRHLANRDPRLRFCLLADLPDAGAEELPGDAALLAEAQAAIEALNAKHRLEQVEETVDEHGEPDAHTVMIEPFLLLVRRRTWSAGEQAWIGRERRRGQIEDLNAFLCGGAREQPGEHPGASFLLAAGGLRALAELRYVIAIEAGAMLGLDAARRLVAAMAHPLNQPLVAPDGRVVEGHGMLRPQVCAALPGAGATRYERLWSDGAGSWAEQGAGCGAAGDGGVGWAAIYEVDAWRRAMAADGQDEGRFLPGLPEEDRLRAGFVHDVRVEAGHPGTPGEHVLRRHRAVRAHWQLARRLVGAAARWRLFDRRRASLAEPAMLALLILCWSTLAGPVFWSLATLSVYFLPALAGSLVALADRPFDAPWRQHLESWARGARVPLVRAALATAFLPHAAWSQLDAVCRALWRRRVSRRRLLEWRPPYLARSSAAIVDCWRGMWFAPALAVATALLLTFANPYALFSAAPLLLVWFLSPVLAWWTSQPARQRAPRWSGAESAWLAAMARRSWSYFEEHPGAKALPPEAVLEHPQPAVDARVSPAGIGLSLLAALAAHDFGFLAGGALLARARATLSSVELLESWRGHLFQWYDGDTLAPLEPAFVSTADSGSLALALRLLAAGLDELPEQAVAGSRQLDGIRATLRVLEDSAPPQLRELVAPVSRCLEPARCRAVDTLPGLADCLRAVAQEAGALAAGLPQDADPQLSAWARRLAAQCEAQLDELFALAPWMRAAQEYVIGADLTRIPTLRELAALAPPAGAGEGLARLVEQGRDCARARLAQASELAAQARELARMDFRALLDGATGLLAAGFHVREDRIDGDGCDLLASEARVASYLAVAGGQLGQEHWWSLGRPVRIEDAGALLLSRCGALSDYLGPQVLMPSWRDTLLDGAGRAAVRAQALHARARDLAWGYAESGCNAVDAAARYRFGRFGLPACALQRRSPDDLVAAPHAAMLALPLAPALALANLGRMAEQGALGEHGYYEAIDYAPARLPQGERRVVVRAWVARHQAQGLLALAQVLHEAPMQRRFLADTELAAALGLLQEALPASGAALPAHYGAGVEQEDAPAARAYARVIAPANAQEPGALPEVQLLSNGRLHAVVASDGGGSARWDQRLLTRAGGSPMVCYVRDADSGALWSNTLTPTLAQPERHEVVLAEGRASFRRHEHGIDMLTDVVVAPDDDVELRRIRIANRSAAPRTLELTSYVELDAPPVEPGRRGGVNAAFEDGALLCNTGPEAPVLLHQMTLRGQPGAPSVETCRARFVGRGADLRLPQAVVRGGALAGADTEPAQPVLAMRHTLVLAPGQEATVDLLLGAAGSLGVARELARRYRSGALVDHAIEAAWTQGQAFLRRMELGEADAQLYTRLAGCVLAPVPALRADAALIARNVLGRADLAPYGVSGALPVVLLQVGQGPDTGLVRQALQAHAYWRSRGLAVDLLVLCDSQAAREQAMHLAAPLLDPNSFEQPGGVHVHLLHALPQEDRILLRSIARVLLSDERGGLHDQLRRAARPRAVLPPAFAPAADAPAWTVQAPPLEAPELRQDNGIGGYTLDGKEYVIRCGAGAPAPAAPWPNLLANPEFGSVVSERGHASSWSGHHGARVTAGGEDELAPRSGEAFYLRDEDSGVFWSPTPWPAASGAPYLTRHGFGYSVFEHLAHGIRSELRCFVAQDAPLKYSVLRLRNDSSAPRRLSVTGYAEWLLDDPQAPPGLQVVTGIDLASGALFARNAFGAGFHDKVGFFHLDAVQVAASADRMEFLGPQGCMAQPAAMARAGLSGSVGAGLDPCAALQAQVLLPPGEELELVFVLGVAGPGSLDASRVVQRHGGAAAAAAAWEQLRAWWDATLGCVELRSPDPALDLLVNGWLPYQSIAAAMGERSPALRLQASLAALHARPELVREQLLRAAQDFAQAGTGDGAPYVADYLWLPFVLARYLAATGDHALLGESPAGREDLYQHCVHGLRGCLRFGERGLPLAGARLHGEAQGPGSRSESVQLAFFMGLVLQRFAEVAERRGDFGFATTCSGAALALAAQAEEHGWDGEWYRWAYLDDGGALGSQASGACRLDLATQAWALLAGAARGEAAMRAAALRLDGEAAARSEPPADGQWAPGLDACPGQEHRATAWAAMALARLDEGARAWQLARLLDPAARSANPDACARYAAPPYFLTDGLRTIAPNAGRAFGGCYTVAPAWTWLLVVEALLGLERQGQRLLLAPCAPPGEGELVLRYRYRRTIYEISVRAGAGGQGLTLDGVPLAEPGIVLADDARLHRVQLRA
ncbi:hypothetical protein B0920_22155 [Massilia sp. KIM]|nr:hypothetical protein B0920_22155 [Massilia sp. KIM]